MGPKGIALCPHYDLLCTGAYHTRALADERSIWPAVELMIPLPGASTFGAVTRKALLDAGDKLGVPQQTGARYLDKIAKALPGALATLIQEISADNAQTADPAVRQNFGGELRLLRTMESVVLRDMLNAVAGPRATASGAG